MTGAFEGKVLSRLDAIESRLNLLGKEYAGASGLDFKDAWNVAHNRASSSNLARCFIAAAEALLRIQQQTMSDTPDIGLITDACARVTAPIHR